jgi:TnpA family transposase
MPSTTGPNSHTKSTVSRRSHPRRRVLYPRLPSILDEDALSAIATLESEERAFAVIQGKSRNQYLYALYLKATTALGHSHFQPVDLPRQFRSRIAEQLGTEGDLARILSIDRSEKSHIVSAVRAFLGLSPVTREEADGVQAWLQADLAKKESDVAILISAVIERFRERRVEIPPSNMVQSIVNRALHRAEESVFTLIGEGLTREDGERLDALLAGMDCKTDFDFFKKPVLQATPNTLAMELLRIERLGSFLPEKALWKTITRIQTERFAELARRYSASELAQLGLLRRRTLLLCFLVDRRAFFLDAVADMAIRVWDNTKHSASDYADIRQQAMAAIYESHQAELSELLSIIDKSRNPEELWHGVHHYKTRQEYHGIMEGMNHVESRSASYLAKIEDHYPALRRFLPDWYRLIPLCSTTTDDAIPRAQAFARQHASSTQTELPAADCPTEFLSQPWKGKAVRRYARTGQVIRVSKAPYELGLLDATVQGLKNGTLALAGARRRAPMTDHLLPREEFQSRYREHAARLGRPPTAQEHYGPLRDQLHEDLEDFDRNYHASKDKFWVNRNGTLGYSRLPGQSPSPRLKRLRSELSQSMPETSILDILLDCQRWTGFMDAFKPVSGRQNMSEDERTRHLLATLYAYGCNCGPVQASRALGILKSQIVYTRRRYMAVEHLMEAAAILAHAYQQTPMAERLGDMHVLLTDSMQVRTLKESMIARQHHRYLSGKSTLLYQHVTSNCVCLFTQALLCNVSEGIHMLAGAMECQTGSDPIINICDSAGKSNLVFGLSSLLNIKLYPRVRSRHLKLWGTGENIKYENIAASIAGQIRCDRIDNGWQDVLWILSSIEAGTAKPLIILNHLAAQPQHPAAQALDELGKLERSLYLLRYGRDMELRRFVVPYTSRREHWNKFTREVLAFGDMIRVKTLEDQEEVFWFLTVVQNAIVLWNALSLEHILGNRTTIISDADLKRMLPTMTEYINFIGRFDLDLQRKPPFELKRVLG